MEGVEILNETIIYVYDYAYHVIWIFTGLLSVTFSIIGAFGDKTINLRDRIKNTIKGLFIGAAVGAVLGSMLVFGNQPQKTDEIDYIEYQAIISDDVNFNEFYDRYEIINKNGKIYQVSTCKVYDNTCFETMIFPIDNKNNVSGHEVYSFHTFEAGESKNKHRDIILHPEKYVSDKVIVNYWKSKEYNSDDTSDDIYIVMGTIVEHGELLDSWVEEVFDNEEQANACYQYLNHMKTQSNVNYWVTNKVYHFCKDDYVQMLKEYKSNNE